MSAQPDFTIASSSTCPPNEYAIIVERFEIFHEEAEQIFHEEIMKPAPDHRLIERCRFVFAWSRKWRGCLLRASASSQRAWELAEKERRAEFEAIAMR